jgi:hypothetical protein
MVKVWHADIRSRAVHVQCFETFEALMLFLVAAQSKTDNFGKEEKQRIPPADFGLKG